VVLLRRPDAIDNGLAQCSLHHKLFDRGALGLNANLKVLVSTRFTARTTAGRAYEPNGRPLNPRPGTPPPAVEHIAWHSEQVFKGVGLAA
jgi:putative restriction endonuclease